MNMAVAFLVLTTNTALANDQQFSLVCRSVKQPEAAPLVVFDVDLRTNTVTVPGHHFPFTKPPKTVIAGEEISYREDYETGWSMTIINRYTGDATMFTASRPDAI